MLQDVYLTYATRESDTLKKLTQEVEMFAAKHSNLAARTRDHANQVHLGADSFVRVSKRRRRRRERNTGRRGRHDKL